MKRTMTAIVVLAAFLMCFSGVSGAMELPRFDGVSLSLLIHPTLYAALGGAGEDGQVGQFEQMTGATVTVETAPIQELREKLYVELISGSDRYDVFTIEQPDMRPEVFHFLELLNDYVDQADPTYDFEDFITSLVEVGSDGDDVYGLPFRFGTTMMYYRTDLMEAAGLSAPANFEELLVAAEALTGDGVYGFSFRGKAEEIVHDFLQLFYAHGVGVLNADWTDTNLDSPAAIQTAELMATLFQQGFVSPETLAWGRDDLITSMQQGRAAMTVCFSPYWGRFVDPDESEFHDRMHWAFVPTLDGVSPGTTRNGGWFLGMNGISREKEATWALIQWLTNKDNQFEQAYRWANGPTRNSTYENPLYLEEFPVATAWQDALANSLVDPPHPRFGEMVDFLSEGLADIVEGSQSAEAGMQEIAAKVRNLL